MIRYPQITGSDPQKLEQIKRYLIDLADELNFVLDQDFASTKTVNEKFVSTKTVNEVNAPSTSGTQESSVSKFNEIKGLIIKSADIVNAYYETINKRLEGVYVAESDFGTYKQETSQEIKENSTSIESIYSDIQTIESDVKGIGNSLIDVDAHIKAGYLYDAKDGTRVYGLEVGQRTEVDGVEVFNKYAQFTSDKLAFFDNNGVEVASISDRKLHIKSVEIVLSMTIGGFIDEVQTDDKSIVTKWIGG